MLVSKIKGIGSNPIGCVFDKIKKKRKKEMMMNTIMMHVQMVRTMVAPAGHGFISYTTFKNKSTAF